VGLVPAVSLLCYGSTESDPVAYVVSPFKRRDGTIPLLIPLRPDCILFRHVTSRQRLNVRMKIMPEAALTVLYESSAASSRPASTVSFVSHI